MIFPLLSQPDRDRLREVTVSTAAGQELVARYVAGPEASAIPPILTDLASKGLYGLVDYVSHEPVTRADADQNASEYHHLIDHLEHTDTARGVELSLQLTWIGVSLSGGDEIALEHARSITRHAVNAGMEVTVAMGAVEDTARTRWIGQHLLDDFPDVALTIRAALLDSVEQASDLAQIGRRIKIVKGHHGLMPGVTHKRRHDTDLAYVKVLRTLIDQRAKPLIASHDPRIIAIAEAMLSEAGYRFGQYEFQMFQGVRPWEQRRLADVGHLSRISLPYGADWFDYYLDQMTSSWSMTAMFIRSLTRKR